MGHRRRLFGWRDVFERGAGSLHAAPCDPLRSALENSAPGKIGKSGAFCG
jgi:hypothetical protein